MIAIDTTSDENISLDTNTSNDLWGFMSSISSIVQTPGGDITSSHPENLSDWSDPFLSPIDPETTLDITTSTSQNNDKAGNTVTATLTEPPPDFSIVAATGTIEDGWITTKIDNEPTLLPVVRGLVLINPPNVPRIEFRFPGFPELPPFHFPCTKVLEISVGGCDSSPVSDEADGSNGYNGDDEGDEEDEDEDASQSTSEPTSTTATETTAGTITTTKKLHALNLLQ